MAPDFTTLNVEHAMSFYTPEHAVITKLDHAASANQAKSWSWKPRAGTGHWPNKSSKQQHKKVHLISSRTKNVSKAAYVCRNTSVLMNPLMLLGMVPGQLIYRAFWLVCLLTIFEGQENNVNLECEVHHCLATWLMDAFLFYNNMLRGQVVPGTYIILYPGENIL